jgi:histidine phosphotransferase ChpT
MASPVVAATLFARMDDLGQYRHHERCDPQFCLPSNPPADPVMAQILDLAIAEVLSARLCHELISPIGAVNNGLELLDDEDGGFARDALSLVVVSARQAARRLQFYRLAYGSTAAPAEEAARAAVMGLFEDGKIEVAWPTGNGVPEPLRKLACNLLLTATETVPRGGQLVLSLTPTAGIEVLAIGEGARVAPHMPEVLGGPIKADMLNPRNVQTAFTRALAEGRGGSLTIERRGDREIVLSVEFAR